MVVGKIPDDMNVDVKEWLNRVEKSNGLMTP